MSLADDLRRNRAVYRLISTGKTQTAQDAAEPGGEMPGDLRAQTAWEHGEIPLVQFRRRLEEASPGGESFQRAVGILGADIPPTGNLEALEIIQNDMGDTMQQADRAQPERAVPAYSIAPGISHQAAPLEYPAVGQEAGKGGGQELLEGLIRRIEAGNRLYPQALGEEESVLW